MDRSKEVWTLHIRVGVDNTSKFREDVVHSSIKLKKVGGKWDICAHVWMTTEPIGREIYFIYTYDFLRFGMEETVSILYFYLAKRNASKLALVHSRYNF